MDKKVGPMRVEAHIYMYVLPYQTQMTEGY